LKLEIGGHTDDVGPPDQNVALSQRRAASVAAYMAAKGVDAARLTATGYGEADPLYPNDTDADRARNRRIEFKVLD
jgi:outer membrane protein OmpA-like peptidoglycan-associated protein